MPADHDSPASRLQPDWHVIHIHSSAPAKPEWGAPCNGCGVCCLMVPCPVGMVYTRRRRGACAALRWDDVQHRYFCGMVSDPLSLMGWPGAPSSLNAWMGRRMRRWIAAGVGCDATALVEDIPSS